MPSTPSGLNPSPTDYPSYCSAEDALILLRLINRCIQAEEETQVKEILESLRNLLGYSHLYFLLVGMNEEGLLLEKSEFSIDWPISEFHAGQTKGMEHKDPVFSILANLEFQHHYWNLLTFEYNADPQWVAAAVQAGLNEGYAVRTYTHNKREFSQIDLSGGFLFDRRTEFILDTIKPHVHKAYTLIRQKQDVSLLEDREKLILQLLQKGMNRRMIAEELAISESRTQQLMNKIYTKLDAHNAPHAVAISLSRGLIDFA